MGLLNGKKFTLNSDFINGMHVVYDAWFWSNLRRNWINIFFSKSFHNSSPMGDLLLKSYARTIREWVRLFFNLKRKFQGWFKKIYALLWAKKNETPCADTKNKVAKNTTKGTPRKVFFLSSLPFSFHSMNHWPFCFNQISLFNIPRLWDHFQCLPGPLEFFSSIFLSLSFGLDGDRRSIQLKIPILIIEILGIIKNNLDFVVEEDENEFRFRLSFNKEFCLLNELFSEKYLQHFVIHNSWKMWWNNKVLKNLNE